MLCLPDSSCDSFGPEDFIINLIKSRTVPMILYPYSTIMIMFLKLMNYFNYFKLQKFNLRKPSLNIPFLAVRTHFENIPR